MALRGHNRDKKNGKRQINFGLLCTAEGCPVAVEVFPGSTADSASVEAQIKKLRVRFGLKRILLVGDRGRGTLLRTGAVTGEGGQIVAALEK